MLIQAELFLHRALERERGKGKIVIHCSSLPSMVIEPEAEVVDSENIRSGNVLVQLIHPGL